MANKSREVFLIKTEDRNYGINELMEQFNLDEFNGDKVAIKANFNSADPFPASTHIDTVSAIVNRLKEVYVDEIVVAERSGMGNTQDVLEKMGVFKLSEDLGFKAVALDKEGKEEWVKIEKNGMHWLKGFYIAKLFLETKRIIQTCCLKTHRFGGHFTLSLKNSVGLIAKRLPGGLYNYMAELHMSPYQRQMIAEINKHYHVDLVVMDAIKAFINKGPEQGKLAEPNLLLASSDRVALDAVGVAILRNYGVETDIAKGKIFELDQIKRASELGFGAQSAHEIELIPLNGEAGSDLKNIKEIFKDE